MKECRRCKSLDVLQRKLLLQKIADWLFRHTFGWLFWDEK
jgi:hypothetical protein